MTRLHYIQHVPFETPGSILNWAAASGAQLSHTRLYDNEHLPNPDEFDLLVVMGGPMGVHDDGKYPWLSKEKAFIEKTLKARKGIMGICLGAQLMAYVLGSSVSKNRYKEIGWYPITTTLESKSVSATGFLPDCFNVLHWHGDTFDLPAGAVRIAVSEGCENQGFVYGDRVVGLQFHLEVTEQSLIEMVKNGKHELMKDKFVQDEEEIFKGKGYVRANNDYMSQILTNLVKSL